MKLPPTRMRTPHTCVYEFKSYTSAQGGPAYGEQCTCVHLASGAVGVCMDNTDKHTKKEEAYRRMTRTEAYRKWRRHTAHPPQDDTATKEKN